VSKQHLKTDHAHAEGRVVPISGSSQEFRYEYFYRDHLGNTRMRFADLDEDGVAEVSEILQEWQELATKRSNSYPYGMVLEGLNTPSVATLHRFGFNGKEMESEFGLNWQDFGARRYDVQLGRWGGVDPLAEDYSDFSPFSFVGNSPTNAIDPDGSDVYLVIWYGKNLSVGHVGFFVDNYIKQIDPMTGEFHYEKSGFIYYDWWPVGGAATFNNLSEDVPGFMTVLDSKYHRSNKSGGWAYKDEINEGKPADAVFRFRTSSEFDMDLHRKLDESAPDTRNQFYNSSEFNCTDFCLKYLSEIPGLENVSGTESVEPVNMPLFQTITITTPNALAFELIYSKSENLVFLRGIPDNLSSTVFKQDNSPLELEYKAFIEQYIKSK
jgi:RHS repeat-associated protein